MGRGGWSSRSVTLRCKGDPAALCAQLRACLGSNAALVLLEALSDDTVYLAFEMQPASGES